MTASEVLGLSGAVMAGYAYLPQITHLVRERCSAGLSERAFALWLVASALMTVHAVTIGAVVFVVLGIQQVTATGLIAFYCRRYRDRACPSHEHGRRHAATAPGVAGRPTGRRSRPRLPGRPSPVAGADARRAASGHRHRIPASRGAEEGERIRDA